MRVHETSKEIKILMEYIPGEQLSKFIKGKTNFSERDIRLLASQLLLGVDLMSKLSIVHRDIKPQNIILIEDSVTKFPLVSKNPL
jgi:serine/threonine protein kinase